MNLVFNEGGIIGKAEKAKEIQRAAEVAEQVEIWKGDKAIAGYMHEGKQKLASFLEELVQKGLITETEKATIEETGSVTIGGRPIKKETSHNDPYFYMYGAKAYVNGITELNKICAMYKNDLASEARSVNIGDINAITGITTDDKIREVDIANRGTNPQGEAHKYKGTYEFENQWTPEAWLANKETPLTKISDTITGYGYQIYAPSEAGVDSATVTSTKQYNLLFENVDLGTGRLYWLASCGVGAYSDIAGFGPGYVVMEGGVAVARSTFNFFNSNGHEHVIGCAVRPVVILNFDVTIDDIQKTDQTETEDTWNYTAVLGIPK